MGRLLVLVALVVVAAAALAGRAAADDAPAGFVSHSELAARVAFIPGRPIDVWCAGSPDTWLAERAFLGASGDTEGFVLAGQDGAYLSIEMCAPLVAKLRGRPIRLPRLAESLLALTHEAEHLAG